MSESLPIEYRILQAIAARVATIRTANGDAVNIGRRVLIGHPLDPYRDAPCAVVDIDGESGVSRSDPDWKPHRSIRVVVDGYGENAADPLLVGIHMANDIERAVMRDEAESFSAPKHRLGTDGVIRLSIAGATYSRGDTQGSARAFARVAFDVLYLRAFGESS